MTGKDIVVGITLLAVLIGIGWGLIDAHQLFGKRKDIDDD